MKMPPSRAMAWSNLGETYAVRGDIQKAVACFANLYRYSRNRAGSYRRMVDLNAQENVEDLKQARQLAMDWAMINYPEIALNNPPKTDEKKHLTADKVGYIYRLKSHFQAMLDTQTVYATLGCCL